MMPEAIEPTTPKAPSNVINDVGLFPTLILPPPLQKTITSQGYVFPVFRTFAYGDTFGNVRKDVPGDWHHGDDIVAPLGTPVLAVAHGTVFSVGFEKIGGRRLWLRDDRGNEFYYAHLSAYSPFAVNGAVVHAGDVLGFVGRSGDAEGGPFHLHEVVTEAGHCLLDDVLQRHPCFAIPQNRTTLSGEVDAPLPGRSNDGSETWKTLRTAS